MADAKRIPAKVATARALWESGASATGTPGHAALADRLTWPPPGPDFPPLPPTVRWLARDGDAADVAARAWPAMPEDAAGLLLFAYRRADKDSALFAVGARAIFDRGAPGKRALMRTIGPKPIALFLAARPSGEFRELRLCTNPAAALASGLLHPGAVVVATASPANLADDASRLAASRKTSRLVVEPGGGRKSRNIARKIREALPHVPIQWRQGGKDAADDLAIQVRAWRPKPAEWSDDDLCSAWREFLETRG